MEVREVRQFTLACDAREVSLLILGLRMLGDENPEVQPLLGALQQLIGITPTPTLVPPAPTAGYTATATPTQITGGPIHPAAVPPAPAPATLVLGAPLAAPPPPSAAEARGVLQMIAKDAFPTSTEGLTLAPVRESAPPPGTLAMYVEVPPTAARPPLTAEQEAAMVGRWSGK